MSDRRRSTVAGLDEPNRESQIRQLAVIWPLLGRTIAFHRRLVSITSNVKAALLLSQAIYWTRHGRDIERSDGWFKKTVVQWELETGLTEREQATARAVLCRLALLSERRIGVPAKLHFRLDTVRLSMLLAESVGATADFLDWADGIAVAEWLGPSLAYHRSLARVARGVHAGLLLSRALHLTRLQTARRHDAWVVRTTAKWTEELGLTRREQERARRDLMTTGIWEELYIGSPPRVAARVRLDTLLAQLAGADRLAVRALPVAGQQECGVPAYKDEQNAGTSRWESLHLVPAKPPIQIRRNRHHRSDETATLLIQGSTGDSVQPPDTRETIMDQAPHPRGGDLIFPERLQPEERAAALVLVKRCGDQAQALLDELSARIQSNAVRTTPIAYLRGLVERASAGTFVPEAGLRIAVARRRRNEETLERRQREQEDQRLAAERSAPEHRAKLAARRAETRQWLDNARRRQGGKCP